MFALIAAVALQDPTAVITAEDPAVIERLVDEFAEPKREDDEDGTPHLYVQWGAYNYQVLFQNCDEQNVNCRSLTLWSYWDYDGSLEQVNDLNQSVRFATVYVDGDGDLIISRDVNTEFGITEATFLDDIKLYHGAMQAVDEAIYVDEE